MNSQQVNDAYNLQFETPRSMVRDYLDFVMNMRPQSEIQVIPDYPDGWHAIFAANNWVWTIKCDGGFFGLIDVASCHGVRPNGTLIAVSEKNGREKAIACQEYFLEWVAEPDLAPITCEDFCDRDESPCRFCKMAKEKEF